MQSVLNSIAIYYMQSSLLPVSICNEVDKFSPAFLWGSSDDGRKPHLVAWDHLTWPKSHGGLGFKSTRCMNLALMMKLGWDLITRPDKLWVQVLKSKYKCGGDAIPSVMKKSVQSNSGSMHVHRAFVWRGSMHVLSGLKRKIGNGNNTSFLRDTWVDNDPLLHSAMVDIDADELQRNVSSYVNIDGDWNWEELRSKLPTGILMRLASILPPQPEDGNDVVVWKFSKDNLFSVKSAYSSLDRNSIPPEEDLWRLIWKWFLKNPLPLPPLFSRMT